jgi:hypothetical protein
MTRTDETQTKARTILAQIGNVTLMAIGAHNPSHLDGYNVEGEPYDVRLSMKVHGRLRWLEVDLEHNDTYTVRLVRLRKAEKIVVDEVSGVYCDTLEDACYRMVTYS